MAVTFQTLRRAVFADGVIFTLGTHVLLGASAFITAPLLSRGLGVTGRGELASIQAVPALIAGFGLFGLNEAIVYWGVKRPDRRRALLSTALVLALMLSGLLSLATLVYVVLRHQSSAHVRYVAFILLTPLTQLPFEVLRSAGRLRQWNLLKALPTTMWLSVALLVGGGVIRSPEGVADLYLLDLALLVPVFLYIGYRACSDRSRPSRQDARTLTRFGAAVALTSAPQAVNLRLDMVIVSQTFSRSRAGIYAAVVGWGAISLPVFLALSALALPRVAAAGPSATRRVLAATAVAFVGITAVGYPVTRVAFSQVFGNDFAPGRQLAYVALVAGCIQGANAVLSATLRGNGRLRLPFIGEAAGLIITLALIFPSLHAFGLAGGQLTSIIAYSTTSIVLIEGIRRALTLP